MTPLIAASLAHLTMTGRAPNFAPQGANFSSRTKRTISPNLSLICYPDRKKFSYLVTFEATYDSRQPNDELYFRDETITMITLTHRTTTMNATPCANAAGYMGFGLATTFAPFAWAC